MAVNKVILVGNLGKDPEFKPLAGGGAVANMTLATSEKWKDKDGKQQEKTEWHRLVAFGKTAELCRDYLAKGRQVYFEGKLQTREWVGKDDGIKRYTTEVVVQVVQFLGKADGKGKAEGPGEFRAKQEQQEMEPAPGADDAGPSGGDDVPF